MFWCFMFVCCLLVPVTMLLFGRYCRKNGGPKEINAVFGYRTRRSMKDEDCWRFAHQYFGTIVRSWGIVCLLCSAVVMIVLRCVTQDVGITGIVGGALCLAQCIALIVPIALTERALKRLEKQNAAKI